MMSTAATSTTPWASKTPTRVPDSLPSTTTEEAPVDQIDARLVGHLPRRRLQGGVVLPHLGDDGEPGAESTLDHPAGVGGEVDGAVGDPPPQ
jgi:hypothetical protein